MRLLELLQPARSRWSSRFARAPTSARALSKRVVRGVERREVGVLRAFAGVAGVQVGRRCRGAP